MKWLVLGARETEKPRFEKLNGLLGSELVFQDWDPKADVDLAYPDFQHVRWGQDVQVEATRALKRHSTWTSLLGVADGMVFRGERWWPLCASYEAFSQMLNRLGPALDTSVSAFVTGTGGMARAAIAGL